MVVSSLTSKTAIPSLSASKLKLKHARVTKKEMRFSRVGKYFSKSNEWLEFDFLVKFDESKLDIEDLRDYDTLTSLKKV